MRDLKHALSGRPSPRGDPVESGVPVFGNLAKSPHRSREIPIFRMGTREYRPQVFISETDS